MIPGPPASIETSPEVVPARALSETMMLAFAVRMPARLLVFTLTLSANEPTAAMCPMKVELVTPAANVPVSVRGASPTGVALMLTVAFVVTAAGWFNPLRTWTWIAIG